MIEAPHYSSAGAKNSGAFALPADYFDGTVNEPVLHQAVKVYLNNQRQGTAKTKTRSFVSGGNLKPWKQKGTGRARQGSSRSPQWRGGGKVHTPMPRDYSIQMPRQMRRAALRSALTAKLSDQAIIVVDRIALPKINTQSMSKALQAIAGTESALVVLSEKNETVERATRNLAQAKTLNAGYLNIRDLFKYEKLVLALGALDKIQEWLDPGRTE
jgi:large subunit ribosomal protein L4